MKPKSLAQDLFYLLKEGYPIGSEFTAGDFRVAAQIAGLQPSEGAVQGFLSRAKAKGVVTILGQVARVLANGKLSRKRSYVFKVKSHEAWNFHPPSKGSEKGRHINQRSEPEQLPLLDIKNTGESFTMPDFTKINGVDRPVGDKPVTPTPETLADALMKIATQVEKLEHRTLADYSNDELINELKRRIKE